MYLVSKLAKCDHIPPSEIINMTDFPLLETILEVVHHGDLVRGGIKEDDAEASSHVHHTESHNDIGPCTVPDSNAIFNPQLVQHGHQVLAYRHRLTLTQFQKCTLLTTAI